jgi:AGCS family alanine or glycine:cation symporter
MKLMMSLMMVLISANAMAESIESNVNAVFGKIVQVVAGLMFFTPFDFFPLPIILLLMISGGLFFTLRYGFVNVTLFKHAIDVLRGRFDHPDHHGEITHFQALTSALSATVGLGNIAGVAVAIQLGGPGAVFWLWVVAFFGMSMKFSSCTFAQLYREVDEDGKVLGGPMVYLSKAYKEKLKLPGVGKFLGVFFSIATIMGAFGGGNLFQANQTYELLADKFEVLKGFPIVVGLVLAFFVGIVIMGGIKRIAEVTSKMVPAMVVFYTISCLIIILGNFSAVPGLFADIFRQAFNPDSIYAGGFVGILIQGIKRASFSNEAGIGSAAIAHAAAKTDEPIREGVVAMLGPFIDTIVVCTMTSLAILITNAHLDPELAGKGALITAKAFGTIHEVMPYLLTIATVVFAYSTVISYSYYGEKATEYLFGKKAVKIFQVAYILVVIFGPVLSLGAVIDFSDMAILSMAFPNIIGMAFISGEVKKMTQSYYKRYKSGKMKMYS